MSGKAKIIRLDTETVNRIAAGEVIQRPSNALKELLENSLDAGASNISVVVKGGGLQLLQISDSGHGILPADFPLLCERFATSKLSVFEDLLSIRTFGFRGEALASISHVAKVTVTSMVEGAACAYKAQFSGGKMIISEKGGEPRPCAGVKGTVIQVEELFLNVPARRAALKNTSEEYSKILEVVTRYAIHFSHRGIGFSCKKANELSPDVNIASKMSFLEAIGMSFGSALKRELIHFEAEIHPTIDDMSDILKSESSISTTTKAIDDADDNNEHSFTSLSMKVSGYVSNANYHVKKPTFIIFVNDRLVDCTQMKRAVEALYSTILPKGTHPFVYISLDLPPNTIDVNLHPTKREVGFLNQDVIVHEICRAIEVKLGNSNTSRSFLTQTLLPLSSLSPAGGDGGGGRGPSMLDGTNTTNKRAQHSSSHDDSLIPILDASTDLSSIDDTNRASSSLGTTFGDLSKFRNTGVPIKRTTTIKPSSSSSSSSTVTALAPSKTVRVDTSHGSLDAYVVPRHLTSQAQPSSILKSDDIQEIITMNDTIDAKQSQQHDGVDNSLGKGTSSISSTRAVDKTSGPLPTPREATTLDSVRGLLRSVQEDNHEGLQLMLRRYVFVGILDRQLSLIQVGTRLLLISHAQLSRELFYQRILQRFGCARSFELDLPCNVEELLFLALNANNIGEIMSRKQISQDFASQLLTKGPMLDEYFSIGIKKFHSKFKKLDTDLYTSMSDTKRLKKSFEEEDIISDPTNDYNNEEDSSLELMPIYITHLPRLIDGHTPCLNYLPDFLLLLAVEVDWTSETECFHSLAQAVALFYAHLQPLSRIDPSSSSSSSSSLSSIQMDDSETLAAQSAAHHAIVAHIIMPSLRDNFFPPRKLLRDHHVVQVAATESLYKVFERC